MGMWSHVQVKTVLPIGTYGGQTRKVPEMLLLETVNRSPSRMYTTAVFSLRGMSCQLQVARLCL